MMESFESHHGTTLMPNCIQKNALLSPYNTFRFSYYAEYLAIAENEDILRDLVLWAKEKKLPITIIGGGSNLLISNNLTGLVIINRLLGKDVNEVDDDVFIRVCSGENWHDFVGYTVQHGWVGIENLALIPGTVGAAPVQNIGAYGVEVKDVLSRIQVMDLATGELDWIEAKECGFAYRHSHFKGKWQGKYVITAVELALSKSGEFVLSYGGLKEGLEGHVSISRIFNLVCAIRQQKLPDPDRLANAGSFFKNPIVSRDQCAQLKQSFPGIVSFPYEGECKLAAGWLIDKAGWKGKQYYGVGVYEKQALVLVNHSEEKANALLELESQIKASVLSMFGVLLEREPVLLPVSDSVLSTARTLSC